MKQQKQIKLFLNETLPASDSERIIIKQVELFDQCVKSISAKSKNQRKMLINTILPRIALYKALINDETLTAQAYEITRKYMIEVVGAKQHCKTSRMERLPFFYEIYSRVFLQIMKKTDLQKSTTKRGHDYYDINITECLWHQACVENGCSNLCASFCEVDDINYGNLCKIGFTRTQTLGTGGTCCDFHFFRKSKI